VANSIPEFFFLGDILFRFIIQGYFCGEFSPPGNQKKRAGKSDKGIFENFLEKLAYLERKKVGSRQI
jgi:hypothetical protein